MKYLIVVTDGAGDDPVESLGGKTPLEVADMKTINELASMGEVGMVKTIPPGIAPGSDAANLSVMGYDPAVYLTGRSPLEAASMGIAMSDTDVSYRVNIISLKRPDGTNPDLSDSDNYEDLIITDHSAGDISSPEARVLIEAADSAFGNERMSLYPGVSYRHCMIIHNGHTDTAFTPPHDVLGKRVGDYLAQGRDSEYFKTLMKKSFELLCEHPVNRDRMCRGLNPANTMWIWGEGRKPALSPFSEKYGITKGSAISGVDLIKGIAVCAGLSAPHVDGATATLDTNYEGKVEAAKNAFESGEDFAYIHIEGPDECSHQGDLEGKIECLKRIDRRIVRPMKEYFDVSGYEHRILIVPDHRTPLAIRTHSSDPVPFVIYDSRAERAKDDARKFNERSGAEGRYFDSGHALADYFFAGE